LDHKGLGLVELWKVAPVRGAILTVTMNKIDGGMGLSLRVETSTTKVEKTNEQDGYEAYYTANGAADDCGCIRFTPADKRGQ
jgi:hypothetical protein